MMNLNTNKAYNELYPGIDINANRAYRPFVSTSDAPIDVVYNGVSYSIPSSSLIQSEYFRSRIEIEWKDSIQFSNTSCTLPINIEEGYTDIILFLEVLSKQKEISTLSIEEIEQLLSASFYFVDEPLIHEVVDNLAMRIQIGSEIYCAHLEEQDFEHLYSTVFKFIFNDYDIPKLQEQLVIVGAKTALFFRECTNIDENKLIEILEKYGNKIELASIEINNESQKLIESILPLCNNIRELILNGSSTLDIALIPFPSTLAKIVISGCSIYSQKTLEIINSSFDDFISTSIHSISEAVAALKENPINLFYIQDSIRNEKEILSVFTEKYIHDLFILDPSLQISKEFISFLISINPLLFQYIGIEAREDKAIITNVLETIKKLPLSRVQKRAIYENIGSNLLQDASFIREAIYRFGIEILEYANDAIRNDSAFILSFPDVSIKILRNIGIELQKSADFTQEAIKKWGVDALIYADETIQNDPRFSVPLIESTDQETPNNQESPPLLLRDEIIQGDTTRFVTPLIESTDQETPNNQESPPPLLRDEIIQDDTTRFVTPLIESTDKEAKNNRESPPLITEQPLHKNSSFETTPMAKSSSFFQWRIKIVNLWKSISAFFFRERRER